MKYIGKYKGNVGTTHGTLVSGLVGYYNRIINLSKYMIGGRFTNYSPNDNLFENKKNTFTFHNTYNGTLTETPPFNGSTNNIVATIDNSTQIDPEFAVTKINRLNSGVTQMDYLGFETYTMGPNKEMEFSFWYYGTFGTIVRLYSHDTDVYVERWNASTNAYITNNSRICNVPVTTNTWQYIQVRFRNTNATTYKRGMAYMVFHYNQENVALSNTEYWKITCVRYWYVESITKNKIIRLNYDYTVDNTWYDDSYTSGYIYQLIYNNRKIYVCGSSAFHGGLVRYNLDGSIDTSFNIGTGFNENVRDIVIDNTNSKIYVSGRFTTYQGITQNRLVRLNMDGSLDTSFNIGTGFDNGDLFCINLDTINQKLYVGGTFIAYQGVTQNRLIRLNLDGTKDTNFNVGSGFNDSIRSITIDNTNSKIYIAGSFTTYNGSTQNRLIRLNMNGTKDTNFNIGTGFNNAIYGFNIDTINQKIYAGGSFTTYQGSTQNGLIRLNMNGTKDTSFNIGTGFNGYIEMVSGILIDNEKNKIYITGNFTIYNNQPQKYIARLNMNGSLDNTFNIQFASNTILILKYTE